MNISITIGDKLMDYMNNTKQIRIRCVLYNHIIVFIMSWRESYEHKTEKLKINRSILILPNFQQLYSYINFGISYYVFCC